MDNTNQGEPPPGPPINRRRAPTITIDTSGVNSSSDNSDPVNAVPDTSAETPRSSKGSRPASPHNVQSPLTAGTASFLAVPGQTRERQSSLDSSDISTAGDATMIDSNASQPEKGRSSTSNNDEIMNDETALTPDVGTEAHFNVEDNPFAFSPGQLNKMFNPKNLAAFYKLGGLTGMEKGLRSNRKAGLSVDESRLSGRVAFEEATRKSDSWGTEGSSNGNDTKALPASGGEKPFQDRLRVFGDNRIPEKKGKSLLRLMWITYNDKVLILLTVAAIISLAVGLYQTFGVKHEPGEPSVEWVEGVAIIVAIAIVVIVGSLNDYSKELQFAKLNRKKQDRMIKVVRSGKPAEISIYEILVGDVVHLEPGDLVPVDGILIEGFDVKCDESQATGESDIIRKQSGDMVYRAIDNHDNLKKMDPFIQSGARIMEGVGTYLATSTGIYSSYGKTLMALNEDPEMTPLQAKLNRIATWIAKVGSLAALLLFLVLFIQFLVAITKGDKQTLSGPEKGQDFITIFIQVVTIIVVAVPEGLPLAVTLALAFATRRMLRDANLVRHLKACEVMGNATSICSDKTGTLTQNVMQVVSGTLGTTLQFGATSEADVQQSEDKVAKNSSLSIQDFASSISGDVKTLLLKSIALNSTAFEGEVDGEKTFIGSKTETALLLFAKAHLGMGPVSEERENATTLQLIPFDSGRKCMGIVVQQPDGKARFYVKGASEIILAGCGQVLKSPSEDISVEKMTQTDIDGTLQTIESYAMRSLRTIGIAYRDFDSWPPRGLRRVEDAPNEVTFEELFKNMTFIGVVGIQDPLRHGVLEAVQQCQKAGVTVRMVTGDNKITGQAIAKECGILQPGGLVMEGPEFRNLSKLQQQEIIPRLQVLARSSPEDKRVLVKRLKENDEIVAVTGDGTNDAPALTTADVGFSMGIAGTEVAKEASSIILMDDNFTSIVKALKWGRAVNDAVKRFLQFQLTVNVTAVVLTFVTAISDDEQEGVLTAVQLLWVNLIMDTLAALALATDPPHDSILNRKPEPRGNFIITPTMWKMILGQAVYQLAITFTLYYGKATVLPIKRNAEGYPRDEDIDTLVFNTFVWMQIFNQWNNRRLDNKFNIFEGLSKNLFFVGISALMCGGQILIIFVGGEAFKIADKRQTGPMWGIAIVLGALSVPIGVLIRLIPDRFFIALIPNFLKRRARKVPGLIVSDEEMGKYPEPLADVRDELQFLKRMKGGRLNNLKFAIQHPRETIKNRSRSASHSRSNSFQAGSAFGKEDQPGSLPTTPDGRRLSRSNRSRSNSLLGAPTVMAGLVAAGVAAAWSPAGRVPSDKDENEDGARRGGSEEGKDTSNTGKEEAKKVG